MLPLLNNKVTNAKRDWINFNQQWDKATFVINTLRHLYSIFLIYYYWQYATAQTTIGQLLLTLYLSLGTIVALATCAMSGALIDELDIDSMKGKCCFFFCLLFAVFLQPFLIIFMYISLLKKQIRMLFYFTIFVNLLWNGLPIYLALCYYLVNHPAGYFHATKLQQLSILIYFILYFLSILFIYPLFMPLSSINTKHLLFKLCTFSLNIIKVLFIVFLLVSFQFSKISVHPFVEYIYDFYLMQFFEITTALCIWVSFYLIPWHEIYLEIVHEMIEGLLDFDKIAAICCGLCYVILLIIVVLVGPLGIFCLIVMFAIYWWIIFELYVFNIIDTVIFVDDWNIVTTEIITTSKIKSIDTWKCIYDYLTNINDSINYTQRLCILHCLSNKNSQYHANIECIVRKQPLAPMITKQRWLVFVSKKFLRYLWIYCEGLDIGSSTRTDSELLHFYDYETNRYKFKWTHIIYIIWELCGLLIIIPIFILSTIVVCILLPLVLFVMYFYVFTEQYSFNSMDYITDFKFWMFIIYLVLFIVTVYLFFIDEYKLISIWYDCQRFGITNLKVINKENIEIYHNHIHEYKMVFEMLNTFFGSLSITIMEYVGIMTDGSLYVPSLQEYKHINDKIVHKNTIVCSNYLFEMETC